MSVRLQSQGTIHGTSPVLTNGPTADTDANAQGHPADVMHIGGTHMERTKIQIDNTIRHVRDIIQWSTTY